MEAVAGITYACEEFKHFVSWTQGLYSQGLHLPGLGYQHRRFGLLYDFYCFLAFNPEPWEGHRSEYGTPYRQEFNCISLQTISGESAETGRRMKTDKTTWILENEKSVWKDGRQGGCGDGKV